MELIEPKVYLVGETRIIEDQLQLYLNEVSAHGWETDAPSDSEKLIEVMGRLCYRSFAPGLNPNVTKVREGNETYLKHILDVGHGSVTEHAFLNFIFMDVSRVVTHELVRHRVGDAFSQESLRFVRLDLLRFWYPDVFRNHPEHERLMKFCVNAIETMEKWQLELTELLGIEDDEYLEALASKWGLDPKKDKFAVKKKLTSAMRRLAPIGLATTIGFSVNPRALRHIIEMRTNPGAEEEIRFVFAKVAEIAQKRYPNLFGDYEVEIIEGMPWYKTKNKKV